MLKALLEWKNLDATKDFNDQFQATFSPGVIAGTGLLSPKPAELRVILSPFLVISNDGMIVRETENTEHLISLNQTTVLCLYAKYNIGAAPTLQYKSLELSAYLGLPNKADHIVFGTITKNAPATQFLQADIAYFLRTEQDRKFRNFLRGYRPSFASIPPIAQDTRPGDSWIVTTGLGDLPALYTYNGTTYVNMTNVLIVASDLATHRANGFSNEIHLTNLQAQAAIGSSGSPNILNRYVTQVDSVLPTQAENDALQGAGGSPSGTNRYLTQQTSRVDTTFFPITSGANAYLMPAAQGPFYLGTTTASAAFPYMALLHPAESRGFTTANFDIPLVDGYFKDAGLIFPLNPAIDCDPQGFFSSDVYVRFDQVIDSNARIVFPKKANYNTLDNSSIKPNSAELQTTSALAVKKHEQLSGRPHSTTTPAEETNKALRESLQTHASFSATFLGTDVVVDQEGYSRLSFDDPLNFPDDLDNSAALIFDNTTLSNFSYNSSTGEVTYLSPVSLTACQAGDIFRDFGLEKFKVVSVGLNTLTIVNRVSGETPQAISIGFVANATQGSVIEDNNPREILLSDLKPSYGYEIIPIQRIFPLPEFENLTGTQSFGIKNSKRTEPRLRLYGRWAPTVLPSGEGAISLTGFGGTIEVTGFFSSLALIYKAKPTLTSILVTVNGRPSPSISLGSLESGIHQKGQAIAIISGRSPLVPTTVRMTYVGSLTVYGLKLVVSNSTEFNPIVRQGRAFDSLRLIKSDLPITATLPPQPLFGRGGSFDVKLNTLNQVSFPLNLLTDVDQGTDPTFTSSGNVLSLLQAPLTPSAKISNYSIGDYVLLVETAQKIVTNITSINYPLSQVTVASTPPSNGRLFLLFNAAQQAPSDSEEVYAIYDVASEFLEPLDTGFVVDTLSDRFSKHKDGSTFIKGKNLGIQTVDGVRMVTTPSGSIAITGVCTRMDIVFAGDPGDAISSAQSVDKIPVLSYGNLVSAGGRVTMFRKARMQSHQVTLTNPAKIKSVILYKPASPEVSVGLTLASGSQVARHISTPNFPLSAAQPCGSVFHDAITEFKLVSGTWARQSSPVGFRMVSSATSSQAQFLFYGTAIEFGFYAQALFSTADVFIDGNGLATYASRYAVPSSVLSGNQVNASDGLAVSVGFGIVGVTGLSRDLHLLSITVTSGLGFSPFGAWVCNDDGRDTFAINSYGIADALEDKREFGLRDGVPDEAPGSTLIQEKTGRVALALNATSKTVTLGSSMAGSDYFVSVSFQSADGTPYYIPSTVTNTSPGSFVVKWNSPIPSNNYKLLYLVKEFS